ncbi:NAD(P)H-dependent oxidoreductase subunit E [Planctomycetota bacterium]
MIKTQAPDIVLDNIISIIDKHHGRQGDLLAILEEIQSNYGYLPKEALSLVAEHTGRSEVDVFGVATFYKSFSLKQRGKHLVSICLGTACHVRGGAGIAQEFEIRLGISPGDTSDDKEFTLETVNCLGACALGPIVVVDGHYFSSVKRSEVRNIIDIARAGVDKIEVKSDQRIFPIEVSCPRCNHTLMDPMRRIDDHPSIRVTVSFNHQHFSLRLSSLYGSYSTETEQDIPRQVERHFFCPHCHTELNSAVRCAECNAQMVPMIVRGGGIVQICSREGCKGHMLDLG